MWPFRRKKERPPPSLFEPSSAPRKPASEPQSARTAEDILRQLDREAAGGTIPGPPDPTIGRLLLAEGPLTRDYVRKQLVVGGKAGSYLGQLLVEVHAPRESELFELLAGGYRVPEVDLKKCKVQVAIARSIPPEIALKYRTVPIERIGDILCVVFADQPNPKAIEAIRRATGLPVKAFRCPSHHIQILLRRLYAREPAAAAARAPAAATVAAIPISEQEHDQIAAGTLSPAEVRWQSLHASKGPVKAVRVARR